MENRSKNSQPHVLRLNLHLILQNLGNQKYAAAILGSGYTVTCFNFFKNFLEIS